MNEIQTIDNELDNLASEAMRSAGLQKMLKFRKGDYFCDGQEVERGTAFIAHVVGWTKQWVKFIDKKPVERKTYRVIKGERAPERDQLPDNDEAARKLWPVVDGKAQDPWVLQYLLPMEDAESGDQRIFVTSSVGGKIAVEELVNKYTATRKRNKTTGQPFIRIQKMMMPTTSYGPTPRPLFEIMSYEAHAEPMRELAPEVLKQAENDMADEIPF